MASHEIEGTGSPARMQRSSATNAPVRAPQGEPLDQRLPALIERRPQGLLLHGRISQLQRLVGNRTTGQVLSNALQRLLIQRSPWTGQTTAVGGLSQQLQQGLLLARGNPNALAVKPGWLLARCQEEILVEFNSNQATYRAEIGKKWDDTAGLQGKFTRDAWINQRLPLQRDMMLKGAGNRVKQRTGEQQGVAVDDQFKWNATFNNLDGDLPGVKGAGGYGEYYAEPAPGDTVQAGFWGRNRILHCTLVGPHQDSWWATADHYTTFVKVV
jgi:hypothetical protein